MNSSDIPSPIYEQKSAAILAQADCALDTFDTSGDVDSGSKVDSFHVDSQRSARDEACADPALGCDLDLVSADIANSCMFNDDYDMPSSREPIDKGSVKASCAQVGNDRHGRDEAE